MCVGVWVYGESNSTCHGLGTCLAGVLDHPYLGIVEADFLPFLLVNVMEDPVDASVVQQWCNWGVRTGMRWGSCLYLYKEK
jgi:hypothetical protein